MFSLSRLRLPLLTAVVVAAAGLIPLLPLDAHAAMTDYPKVRLRSLDKVTARTMTFDAKVGTTIKFGSIYIKIQACQKPDLQEQPEASAFLQIWEITPDDQSKWIFSGWMFASSPAVSAMDHPIYDVWVIDCLDDGTMKKPVEPEPVPATPDAAPKAASNPAPAPQSQSAPESAEPAKAPETPQTPVSDDPTKDDTSAQGDTPLNAPVPADVEDGRADTDKSTISSDDDPAPTSTLPPQSTMTGDH